MLLSTFWLANFCCSQAALADAVAPAATPAVPTGPLPTDLTPIRLREERELFSPTFYMFQKLPANLWFNTSSEVNLRYESNVFLTANHPKRDIVFRTFPSVTVGYNFLKNTGIYSSYFMIKDVYGGQGTFNHLTIPTTQSVSMGVRHYENWKNTYVQFDFQARELWQAVRLHQFDFIPGVLLSRVISAQDGWKRKVIGTMSVFSTLQLQLRGKNYFEAPTREIDPFYTIGALRPLPGNFVLSVTDTFITNFRNHQAIPPKGNIEMIGDIELYRPIMKRHPSLVAFVRAEPIWNWGSGRVPGISGFDFRVYGGVRLQANKAALGGTMAQLRQQFQQQENSQNNNQSTPQNNNQTSPQNNQQTTPKGQPAIPPVQSRPGSVSNQDSGTPPPLIIPTAYGPIVVPRPELPSPNQMPPVQKTVKAAKTKTQKRGLSLFHNNNDQPKENNASVPPDGAGGSGSNESASKDVPTKEVGVKDASEKDATAKAVAVKDVSDKDNSVKGVSDKDAPNKEVSDKEVSAKEINTDNNSSPATSESNSDGAEQNSGAKIPDKQAVSQSQANAS